LKRHQWASLATRTGAVIFVIGLAFSLAAFVAENTPTPQYQTAYSPFNTSLPGHDYDIVCCDPPFVTPKEFISINIGPLASPSAVGVYLLNANATTYQALLSGDSFYGAGNSSLFVSYLSSHSSRLLREYSVSPMASLQAQYFPQNVEQLMVVLLNPAGVNASFTSFITPTAIVVAPQPAIVAAVGFMIVGGVLFAVGYVLVRPKQIHEA
jgi:hypothetical protein